MEQVPDEEGQQAGEYEGNVPDHRVHSEIRYLININQMRILLGILLSALKSISVHKLG